MKKILLGLLILPINLMAQDFAPTGATWYYNFESTYAVIQSTGDSVIQGKNCKILQGPNGVKLVYSDSNIVYHYRNGIFYKLYDFNALPGASWTVTSEIDNCQGDTTATLRVDSIGTTIINADTLKYIVVSFPDPNDSWWGFSFYSWNGSCKIIEKIGSSGYMFPQAYCIADISYVDKLRCYSDSAFGFYETGIVDSCNYIDTSDSYISESSLQQMELSVYPNPAVNQTLICFETFKEQEVVIEIKNILGQTVYFEKIINAIGKQRKKIYFTGYAKGLYLLKVRAGDDSSASKKIIYR